MPPRNGRPRSKSGPKGTRLAFLSLVSLVILSLTFAVGILVGRQWTRTEPALVQAEKGKKPGLAARGGLRDAQAERTGQIREKLTFYQDLPAPLGSPPPSGSRPGSASAEPEKRSGSGIRGAGFEHPVPAPRPTPPNPRGWTVQVAAYGTPEPADELSRSLISAGHDAYVVTASTDDGKVRYRVRVGRFPNRSEAEKTAQRLRAERSLSPFVTTRAVSDQPSASDRERLNVDR